MFSRGVRSLLLLSVLLCAASFVCAQTVMPSSGEYDSLSALSVTSDFTSNEYPAGHDSTLPCSSVDINIFREQILKPPSYDDSSASLGGVETLPPVPATMLMTLVGFACVSLVKDRKAYIAALGSMIWLGQAGIHALPHISFHLKDTKHNLSQQTQCLYNPSGTHCLQKETESERYISLLHYLEGIPAPVANCYIDSEKNLNKDQWYPTGDCSLSAPVGIAAFIGNFCDYDSYPCMKTFSSGDLLGFSPAFIFQSIPRGPPFLS